MSLRYKNIIYSVILILAVFLVWKYRQSKQTPLVAFTGKTMGPITYNVKYFDKDTRNFKPQVDSLLRIFNQSMSTYIPESEISQFNRDTAFQFGLPFFYAVLQNSRELYGLTKGAFDPTVMPLVNAWGFGPEKRMKQDSSYIDSLRQIVGFDKIKFDGSMAWKEDPRVQLDFSASAKGYGVDVVADFLTEQGVEHLFVEIGGEVIAKGKNIQLNAPWRVGVLHPDSDEINQFYIAIASLEDRAMATSGNYFNYYVVDGVKYSHTISPFTGYPIIHPLLSATVFAEDCMTADGLATAFMVMGHEKAIEMLNENPNLDAYLIYTDADGELTTYATAGIKDKINPVK
ncbi:Thiamin biosynthesis lipoprotein ApbE [Fulvivirga imtechensis AK7]|uniref:FAD:protein FMN transferase n=1 Tax=Fulvivirga imtechensis AK7 TaxID=1237149 RepID=L8JV15_9BACT|nr:FAD:protein FMN transferase [Fulvivirga imtechensis]ELR71424.1 Thiamin biosynthesis lipoprotein ApbE [Fulvivirga imtechensis AK7]